MKSIVVPTTTLSFTLKNIGALDHTLRLPMAGRVRSGMKTICDRCRQPITDEFFIGGFKAGMHNMKFHECCVDT